MSTCCCACPPCCLCWFDLPIIGGCLRSCIRNCCGAPDDHNSSAGDRELMGATNYHRAPNSVAISSGVAVNSARFAATSSGSGSSSSNNRGAAFPQPSQSSDAFAASGVVYAGAAAAAASSPGVDNTSSLDDTPTLKKKRSVSFAPAGMGSYDTRKLIHNESEGTPKSVYKRRSSFCHSGPMPPSTGTRPPPEDLL
jgi:hypothetical protein